MADLGTLPGGWKSYALGINDRGQVVGYSNTSSGNYSTFDGFLYTDGIMIDLGPGEATGINSGGQVVGYTKVNSVSNAFLYSDGVKTSLGTLGGPSGSDSMAHAINDEGQVVGYASTSSGLHAFLYSSGTMTDLNSLIDSTSGLTLIGATAINDCGQIVGYCKNSSGTQRAFLLTPVPEPSSLLLFGIGTFGLLGYAWQRRMA
jgi:probable HAF family extracellular repeat protein